MPDVVLQGGNAGQWNVTVTIYQSDGATLATVYADAGGSVSGANPLPKQRNQGDFGVDNAGNWTCYLPAGDYQVGVQPAGGSETKTPFTVAAAAAPDVGYELTSVYGSRADGDVPVWNAARGRLEWGAGGGGGGTSQLGPAMVMAVGSGGLLGNQFVQSIPMGDSAYWGSGPGGVWTGVMQLGAGNGLVAELGGPHYSSGVLAISQLVFKMTSLDGANWREALATGTTTPLTLASDGGWSAAAANDWITNDHAGSDITIDSSGQFVSAAGGLFVVTVAVVFADPLPTP